MTAHEHQLRSQLEEAKRRIRVLRAEADDLKERLKKYESAPPPPGPCTCEAIVPDKWYEKAHRCRFRASEEIDGKKLCGTHAASMRARASK